MSVLAAGTPAGLGAFVLEPGAGGHPGLAGLTAAHRDELRHFRDEMADVLHALD